MSMNAVLLHLSGVKKPQRTEENWWSCQKLMLCYWQDNLWISPAWSCQQRRWLVSRRERFRRRDSPTRQWVKRGGCSRDSVSWSSQKWFTLFFQSPDLSKIVKMIKIEMIIELKVCRSAKLPFFIKDLHQKPRRPKLNLLNVWID